MFGYKIVKEQDVSTWQIIEKDYDNKCKQNFRLKTEIEDRQRLMDTLVSKLKGTDAVIYTIGTDKNGNDTFVCMMDQRKPVADYKDGAISLSGDVNLFALSCVIYPTEIKGKYNDMPFLQAEFRGETVKIIELHSDVRGESYENLGYATMLVDALKDIAKKAGCKQITGMLSDIDAQNEDDKNYRNNFYMKRGFSLSFTDENQKNGSIHLEL